MENRKNILITGGAGFIGANLARKLVSFPNFEVFVIEKKNTNLWRIKDIVDSLNIEYVNLENFNMLSKAIDNIKPSIIFHLASYGVYPGFQNDLGKMISTNIQGTLNLINSLKNYPISSFVNTGTCFEYKEKKSKLNENDFTDPLNFYAITKLTAGLLLRKLAKENNIPVINLRLFTPYGYYEDGQRLIPYIILSALKNKKIELVSPNNVRDFVFIEDVIDLFLKITKIEDKHSYRGEVFNVGSGEQHNVKDVVDIMEKLLDKKLNVRYGISANYYNEPKFFLADNNKTRAAFNWKINHGFEAGVNKTIDWFKKNSKLYLSV